MNGLGNFLANTWLGGLIKNFVSVVLVAFLADLTNAIPVDFAEVKTYLLAGLIAVLPVIINALNQSDGRYGVGKQPGA